MNSYQGQGQMPRAMTEDMRPNRQPVQEADRGAISLTIQSLHKEIDYLNEEISALSECLAPFCTGRPVGTAGSAGNEEKQMPASKHAEELRELQGMVRSCRTRINVIVGQLDI